MHGSVVKMYGDLMVFSGTANRPLAEAIVSVMVTQHAALVATNLLLC